ncbi:MAG: transporter [Flavobacteriaceae bacterium]|nr:transporter [Flavobacteriaceae bacterium]
MNQKIHFFIGIFFICFGIVCQAQYTETINSNRPGFSQGAFAVGEGVIQLETGLSFGNDKHRLRRADANIFGTDYALRYGFKSSRFELMLDGTFLTQNESILVGGGYREFVTANFQRNTIGGKYLIYDPWVEREMQGPDIRSWKRNNTLQWWHLIPAVSGYFGLNTNFGESPFMPPNDSFISTRMAIITQHNFKRWVLVSNFIMDRGETDFRNFTGIFTLTHTINYDWSVFGEFQSIIGDYYSDELLRGGAAYLVNRNLQVDVSALVNFKDTPQRWQVAAGVSYRFDRFFKEDYIFESKEKQKEFEENKKKEKIRSQRKEKFNIP